MTVDTLLFILTGGIVLGALYALMATGLAVIWTTLGIFNFAHGAFIAVGAYAAWQFSHADASNLGIMWGTCLAVILMFFLGVLFHWLLIRPFERRDNLVLATVITTLAGATILENSLNLIFGARSKQISPIVEGDSAFLGLVISTNEVVLMILVVLILFALGYFLRGSKVGRSMRAVAQNREAAELMGFDVPRLYAMAFGLSAAVAGLAGIFVGTIRYMDPSMGSDPLMKSLLVVIFGGIARFTSPVYAAFIVGMVEAFSIYYVGLYWAPAVLFAMMIVVLIIKPEGLFGKHQRSVS